MIGYSFCRVRVGRDGQIWSSLDRQGSGLVDSIWSEIFVYGMSRIKGACQGAIWVDFDLGFVRASRVRLCFNKSINFDYGTVKSSQISSDIS